MNAPVTTSAGRLFDAVAALLGLRQRATYEGQAAQELEWAADGDDNAPLPADCAPALAERDGLVDRRLGADAPRRSSRTARAGLSPAGISRGFHQALAGAIAAVARRMAIQTRCAAGGCFQNARLTEATVDALRAASFTRATGRRRSRRTTAASPLGQAVWAARELNKGELTMCLAVPGKVLSIAGDDPLMRVARVDFGGIVKEINLAYTPEAEIGSYVLVHVGFAITVTRRGGGRTRVFEHLKAIGDLDEMDEELARQRERCQ